MVDLSGVSATRRRLTGKRAETVRRLSEAATEVLGRTEYSEVTLQAIATEAGVARATAYIYFASKEHLVAEVYWQRLLASEPAQPFSSDPVDRVVAVLRSLVMVAGDEPRFAFAVSQALLSADSDVTHLRFEISREIHRRIVAALGDDADATTVTLLELVYTGAMVRGGTGLVSFDAVADTVEVAARRILAV
ncbi:TetR/AcrR family transcriptional regulator [Gordonia rhizosphera NBRC 16068]